MELDVFKPLVKIMIREKINISLIKILSMKCKFNFQKLCLQNHNVSSKTFPNIIADMEKVESHKLETETLSLRDLNLHSSQNWK